MTYAKGVYYERDLIKSLDAYGFSTARIAGSGHNTPADILAMRKNIIIAIECKAHIRKPYLNQAKIQELKKWCDKAGAIGFLAWRAPQQDWRFLSMASLESGKYEDENWLTTTSFLAAFL